MKPVASHESLGDWVENLLSKGKTAFSLKQAHEAFSDLTEIAIKRSLNRLSRKGKIVSIYKGYYLIIPPQYASRGILPPALYLDDFMRFLERPYYAGLLSAAAYHGAAHQQPQEFFVVTSLPALLSITRKGMKVNYISKKAVAEKLIEKRKTESGYLNISSPVLTAADLVQFEKRVGGLNRAATVLNELSEVLKPEMFNASFFDEVPTTTIQRLGLILERVVNQPELANKLWEEANKAGLHFFRIPLKASEEDKGFHADERWKVIVNTEIEIDE